MPETENTIDRLLTVDQVATRLNVGPRFVRRLIQERRIEVRHLGKHVRIKESAVEAFIEAGAVPAVPRPRARRRAALWPVAVASAAFVNLLRDAGRLVTPPRTAPTARHPTRPHRHLSPGGAANADRIVRHRDGGRARRLVTPRRGARLCRVCNAL